MIAGGRTTSDNIHPGNNQVN